MPWTNSTSTYSDGGSPLQTTVNIFFALMIVVFFFIVQSYRTSIDAMEAEIAGLSAAAPVAASNDRGAGTREAESDELLQTVSAMRDRIGMLDDRVETLASKSVDVRSMEALRDEMLVTRGRLAEIETGLEALDASAQEGGQTGPGGDSGEDVEKALAEARAAREEIRRFKTLLGYGDM